MKKILGTDFGRVLSNYDCQTGSSGGPVPDPARSTKAPPFRGALETLRFLKKSKFPVIYIVSKIKFGLVLSPAASCSLVRPRRGIRRGVRAPQEYFRKYSREYTPYFLGRNFVVEELAPPMRLCLCGFIPEAKPRGILRNYNRYGWGD